MRHKVYWITAYCCAFFLASLAAISSCMLMGPGRAAGLPLTPGVAEPAGEAGAAAASLPGTRGALASLISDLSTFFSLPKPALLMSPNNAAGAAPPPPPPPPPAGGGGGGPPPEGGGGGGAMELIDLRLRVRLSGSGSCFNAARWSDFVCSACNQRYPATWLGNWRRGGILPKPGPQ